ANVNQCVLAAREDSLHGPGILEIVKITEHHQVHVRIPCQTRLNDPAQDSGLLLTQFSLVRFRHFTSRFEVRRDQCKGIAGINPDIHFRESATDTKFSSANQEGFVRVWTAADEGESAQDSDMDVGVKSIYDL